MEKAAMKSFDNPDEIRTFPKGKLELITVGGRKIGRATFEPGWDSSTCVTSIMRFMRNDPPSFQYHMSGTLMVSMDDGTEVECRAGDVSLLPAGYDIKVVGDEPVVVVDFQGFEQ
ncbi:MAG: cupin [Nitrospirae bacterium]|nr:cupin [Nitrospirota bacterium]